MSEQIFDRDKFAGVVGSTFAAKGDGIDNCELSLVEVSELKDRQAYRSFSLLFLAPENRSMGQGLYELQHESFDPMALFLVPVGSVDGRTQLEAVFNLAS
jgi:hypothetical protein